MDVLSLLQERLDSNDQKRATVQQDISSKIAQAEARINETRERLLAFLNKTFMGEQEELLEIVNELSALSSSTESATTSADLVKKARERLCSLVTPVVATRPLPDSVNLDSLLSLRFEIGSGLSQVESVLDDDENDIECGSSEFCLQPFIEKIKSMIDRQDSSRVQAQDAIIRYTDNFLCDLKALDERVSSELEPEYRSEDERLQKYVSDISARLERGLNDAFLCDLCKRARAELIVEKNYSVTENPHPKTLRDLYNLEVSGIIRGLEEREHGNVRIERFDRGLVCIGFDEIFDQNEQRVLESFCADEDVKIKVSVQEETNESASSEWELNKPTKSFTYFPLKEEIAYSLKLWTEYKHSYRSGSSCTTFRTPKFSECCAWSNYKEREVEKRYTLSKDKRVITLVTRHEEANICGNTLIPLDKVTTWSIKVLKSRKSKVRGIYVGVARFGFEERKYIDPYSCEWWGICCYDSTLWSGPPHNYSRKTYGPKKKRGQYVHDGDSVGVVMDTTKGDLSFVLDGVNYGIAYEGISLDKPLVPYVHLNYYGDSIELVI